MIQSDAELRATQERLHYFETLLANMRVRVSANNFHAMATGYRSEIEKLHKGVLDYLTRHASESVPAESV